MRVAILMTVFNRRLLTDRALHNLYRQIDIIGSIDYRVYMTDGGSSDGTFEWVKQEYPQVNIYKEPGAFWNSGMWNSWNKALESKFDFYLWLNDDVDLSDQVMSRLSSMILNKKNINNLILVGSTHDPYTRSLSYGALKIKHKYSPMNFEIDCSDGSDSVTFNGNFVLIPHNVVTQIGILDKRFSHSFGDIDYGLRASKSGIRIMNLPFIVGYCARNLDWSNMIIGNSSKVSFTFILKHPKGIPYKEWFIFTKMHGGKLWLLRFYLRYVFVFTRILKSKLLDRD